LLAYSACEKLPCCGIGLSLSIQQPILPNLAAKSALFQHLPSLTASEIRKL
jgi:hypothetical protein